MAIKRMISLSFWTDSKIDDNFTPEDKYFYLYLLTNPHTDICGCYEISDKQMIRETGYNIDTIHHLIDRMESQHHTIRFCRETHEMLILNWYKYNWTESDKMLSAVESRLSEIKCEEFKEYISARLNGDTVSIPYIYGINSPISISNTKTKSNTKPKPIDEFKEFAGDDEELYQALKDYEEYRQKKRNPLTPRAKSLTIRTLEKAPREHWIQMIDKTIEHGWSGIFLFDEDKAKKPDSTIPGSYLSSAELQRLKNPQKKR